MLGIILGLITIMVLAYIGWSIIWVAPIAAGIVAYFGGLDLLNSYTGNYMGGFVSFAKTWFPVFMLGAIFGKLMELTNMANSVAIWITKIIGSKRAILGIVIACGVLTYGGVSLFVVVFAAYPIALSLFRENNIPRRLIPGTIALGSFTFTMTAIPGSPQIQNLIPMKYFHTTAIAAPAMGIVAALIMLGLGYFYLSWKQKVITGKGETFDEPTGRAAATVDDNEKNPNVILSIIPLLGVVVSLNLPSGHGLSIVPSLLLGVVLILVLNLHQYKKFIGGINEGASGSVLAIINTSAAVGFGSVVKAVPGFKTLSDALIGMQGSPLISEGIAVTVLAGATGSASGGMGIALEALGHKYYEIALAKGINPELFHRVASIASGGLDTLPHNGAVLTLLAITGMTHKKSYLDIAVVSLFIPLISLAAVIILSIIGIF